MISAASDLGEEEAACPGRFLQLVPRRYILGVGCRKGVKSREMWEEYLHFMEISGYHPYCVSQIVSIDNKREEGAIKALGRELVADFKTYPKEALLPYEDLYPGSDFGQGDSWGGQCLSNLCPQGFRGTCPYRSLCP